LARKYRFFFETALSIESYYKHLKNHNNDTGQMDNRNQVRGEVYVENKAAGDLTLAILFSYKVAFTPELPGHLIK